MIDLYYWPTPNGRKISILLEELRVKYKIIKIDINKGEQFNKSFSKIAPSNKIPAIIDHEKKQTIFESTAILIYLSNKYNRFHSKKYYWETYKWLMFQTSQVGPFLGQAHQFLYYNLGKSKFAEKKYINYTIRVYETLDKQLKKNSFLAKEYSIADIATWPWITSFEKQKINIKKYPNILRWYKKIASRPAVIKGFNPDQSNDKIPLT